MSFAISSSYLPRPLPQEHRLPHDILEKARLFRENSVDELTLIVEDGVIHILELALVLIHLWLKELFPDLEEVDREREKIAIQELLRGLHLHGALDRVSLEALSSSIERSDEEDFIFLLVNNVGQLAPASRDHDAICELIRQRQFSKALRYIVTLYLLDSIDSSEISLQAPQDEAFLIQAAFDEFETAGNFEPLFPILLRLVTRYTRQTGLELKERV